jgi:hypothetical protein
MSAVFVKPPVKPGVKITPSTSPAAPAAVEFRYTQTDSFPALLRQLGASLLISTYQANKLLVARAHTPLSPQGRGVGGEGYQSPLAPRGRGVGGEGSHS